MLKISTAIFTSIRGSRGAWLRPFSVTALALFTAGAVWALTGAEPKGALLGKPLPDAPLVRPGTASADTTALLPAGRYSLEISFKGESMKQSATITRNGTVVTAVVGVNESLMGSLDASGKLRLQGDNSKDRLELSATVQNQSASGQAQLGRGSTRLLGSFTLAPELHNAKELPVYTPPGKPAPAPECGFWCKVGKAIDCAKNWSSC